MRPVAVVLAAGLLAFLAFARPAIAVTVLPPSATPVIINTPGIYEGGPIDVGCGVNNDVQVNADNVTLRNMTLRNGNEAAVRIGAVKNTVLENVTITGFNCANGSGQYRAGVACWGCTALTVRDSHIETTHTYGNGIWIKGYNLTSGGYHTITGNTISGGWDGIGGEPEGQVYGGVYRDTLIEGNHISACHDDGIQVEGGDIDVLVGRNVVEDCGIGIAFAANLSGPLRITGNTIRSLRVGDYGQQACYKAGAGGKGTTYITGDTCITKGDGVKQTNGGLSPIVARGNCWVVSRYSIELADAPAAGTSFDGDTLWSSDDERAGRFVKWGGTRYGSLSAWRAAAGQEPNGVQSQACPSGGTPTPTIVATPTATPAGTPTPTATGSPSPTPTPTPTPTPQPTATVAPLCELWARIDGVERWMLVDCAILGVP